MAKSHYFTVFFASVHESDRQKVSNIGVKRLFSMVFVENCG